MKYLMLLSLFSLFCCKAIKNTPVKEKEPFAVFSKGACLGKCPVFDFTIYDYGSYRYVGIKNVTQKGETNNTLSTSQFDELKKLLSNTENLEHTFQKIRDKAIITLTYKNKTTKFHITNAPSELCNVNNWFDDFISEMNKTNY